MERECRAYCAARVYLRCGEHLSLEFLRLQSRRPAPQREIKRQRVTRATPPPHPRTTTRPFVQTGCAGQKERFFFFPELVRRILASAYLYSNPVSRPAVMFLQLSDAII